MENVDENGCIIKKMLRKESLEQKAPQNGCQKSTQQFFDMFQMKILKRPLQTFKKILKKCVIRK